MWRRVQERPGFHPVLCLDPASQLRRPRGGERSAVGRLVGRGRSVPSDPAAFAPKIMLAVDSVVGLAQERWSWGADLLVAHDRLSLCLRTVSSQTPEGPARPRDDHRRVARLSEACGQLQTDRQGSAVGQIRWPQHRLLIYRRAGDLPAPPRLPTWYGGPCAAASVGR